MQLKVPKRHRTDRPARDSETKQQTYDLFTRGHSIGEIMEIRGLKISTIEDHLAFYLMNDKLSIGQLMDENKIDDIRKAIEEVNSLLLAPIKERLGDDYSYGEIRWVKEYLRKGAAAPKSPEGDLASAS